MAKVVEGVALAVGAGVAMYVDPALVPMMNKLVMAGLTMAASATLGTIAEDLRGGPGYSASIRQPAAARQVVYGQARVSGVVLYTTTTGHQLNQIIAWASHQCQSIDNIYLDGRQFHGESIDGDYLRGDGNTYQDESGNDYSFGHGVYIGLKALGDDAGYWYQALNSQNTAYWDSSCMLKGICASYFKLTYSSSEFSGTPGIKATIHGKCDIYDPRTQTTGWSNNAALCIANFLCDKEFGIGCDYATEIDEDALIAAANICDEQVTLANGMSESRYTINGTFDTNSAPGDILDSMLMACEGRISYSGGKWKIYPAAWYGSDLQYDQSALTDKVQWVPTRKYRDRCNAVRATYVSPVYPYAVTGYDQDHKDNNIFSGEWQPTDAPEYAQDANHGYSSDANLAADGGVKLYNDRRYQFVTSCSTAQRLMKIYLMRNRQQGSGVLKMNLTAYKTQAQNVVQMTFPALGWTDKYLEVEQLHFVPSISNDGGKTAPTLGCELQVQETDPSVYSWSTAEERGIEDTPSPTLDLPTAVDPPSGLTLEDDTSTALVLSDGTTVARVLATWTEPDDPFVTTGGTIQIQYQLSTTGTTEPTTPLAVTQNADGTWSTGWIGAPSVAGNASNSYLDMPNGFQAATVQIRSVRANGSASAWIEATTAQHVIVRGTPILPAGGIKFADTGKTLDTLEPLEAGAEKTTGKDLSVLSGRTADKLTYLSGGATVDSLKPAAAGADVTSQNPSGGVVGHVIIYRAPTYSSTNQIGNATWVNDSANGASLSTVASFTAGWAGTANVNNAHGITPGTYDVYVRARSNGSGSSPTSLNFGIYDSTSGTTPLSSSLAVSTSYAEIYAGRVTFTGANVDDNTIFYFSSAGVTTTYYVDWVRFQPSVSLDTNIVEGTYARTLSSRVSSGRPLIDFSESIHLNKTAANIPYASGQSIESMKPAQAGADVTSQNALSLLLNPSFETGDLTGWNNNGGTWTVPSGSAYDGSYAAKCTAAGNIANQAIIRATAGQRVVAACFIDAANATGGYADVEIHWHNDSGTLIGTTAGNQVTAATSGWVQSRVVASVPSGATNGTIFCVVNGLTSGSYLFDDCNAAYYPTSLVEVPDGGGRYAAAESGANVTNAHVLTATSQPSATVSTPSNLSATWTAVTGFGWSANTQSSSDVYNFSGSLRMGNLTGGTNPYVVVGIIVDGNTSSPAYTATFYFPSNSAVAHTVFPFFASITGLSVGSHTIQIYIQSDVESQSQMQTGSYAICQRVF